MRIKGTVGLLAFGAVAAVAALEGWQQFRQVATEAVQPAARSAAQSALANAAPLPFADHLRRERLSGEVIGEPFGAREAPRQAVAAAPPPAPVAAPFPYRYAGQFSLEDGKRRVYLMKGNDLVLINVGDTLDGVFKVTAIAADSLEVLHVPSSISTLMQYSSLAALETGSAIPGVSGAVPGTPTSLSPRAALSGGTSAGGAGPSYAASPIAGAGVAGAPAFAGSPLPGNQTPGVGTSSMTAGTVPQGLLGSPGPAAGTARLGVAPAASGSMPMLPAPVGVMSTLPPPTGRLGM